MTEAASKAQTIAATHALHAFSTPTGEDWGRGMNSDGRGWRKRRGFGRRRGVVWNEVVYRPLKGKNRRGQMGTPGGPK